MTIPNPSLIELVKGGFGPERAEPIIRSFSRFAEDSTGADVTVGLSVAGPFQATERRLDSLMPLLEDGHVDWMVARGEDLYYDAEGGFEAARERGEVGEPAENAWAGDRLRLGDQLLPRSVVESTEDFLGRLIVAPPFQKILATSELNALLGKFLAERDQCWHLPPTSLLAVAYRQRVPVFSDSPGGSVLGRRMAAAALSGNRLVLDLNRDVNLAAAIVLQGATNGRTLAASIGGGSSRDLLLQASLHLERPLGLGDYAPRRFLEVASPGRTRLAERFDRLWPGKELELEAVELPSDIAVPLLSAFCLSAPSGREPRMLYGARDRLLERLRDGYLRHDLERQVRATSAQFQAVVQESQSKIATAIEETQANLQAEVSRVQHQVQQQVQKLIHQMRPTGGRRPEERSDDEAWMGDE